MIEDKRKIKEIYKCKYIVSDEALYPLQKWYNQLIDKTVCEITIADVLRMLRQKDEWSYEGEMEEFKGAAMILLLEVLDQSRKKD